MKINKSKPSHWWALISFGFVCGVAYLRRRTLSKECQKPIILLYGHKLNSNLKALYQELEKHDDAYEFYFLTMDKQYHHELVEQSFSTLYACSPSSIKPIANTSVIVTDHGLHCLELFLGKSDIKFMDVWHGLPFKGFDAKDFKVQHKYDAICVTSKHLKNLYRDKFGFNDSQIKITGYGRSDLLLLPPTDKTYIAHAIPNDGSKVILYAPTWKQDDADRSIYPFNLEESEFLAAINKICNRINAFFVIRTHLNSSEIPANQYERVLFRPHSIYPDTESLLSITDTLVCDWSSISLDYLVLGRTTLYLDVEPPFSKGLSLSKECRAGKIINSAEALFENLCKLKNDTNENKDGIQKKQKNTLELLYDGTNDGLSAMRYLKEINKLLRS